MSASTALPPTPSDSELVTSLREVHGIYLERLALQVVRGASPQGVVTVTLRRHAERAVMNPDRHQDRCDVTRLFLRVCTDVSVVEPGGRDRHALPPSMTWLGELVVLRRLVRALRRSERLGAPEVADLLGISTAAAVALSSVDES